MEKHIEFKNEILNLQSSIKISHIISILTNLILFIIFFSSENSNNIIWFSYKYIGLIIHLFLIIINCISLFIFFNKEKDIKIWKKYKSKINYISLCVYFSLLFHISLLISIFIYKYDNDIFIIYAFSILLWLIFHIFFIIIIKPIINDFIKKNSYSNRKGEKYFDK